MTDFQYRLMWTSAECPFKEDLRKHDEFMWNPKPSYWEPPIQKKMFERR